MKYLITTLEIVVVIAIIIGAGYFLYASLFPSTTNTPSTSANPVTSSAATKLTAISQTAIYDYWLNSKTSAIYYLAKDGRVLKTLGDGREEEIGKQNLPAFNRLIASPDGAKIIVVFNYPADSIFAAYDVEESSWERLPAGTLAAAFDPASQKIAFLRAEGQTSNLYVLNLADKKTTKIMSLNVAEANLLWRRSNELLIVSLPTALMPPSLWILDIAKKTLTEMNGGATTANMIAWPDSAEAGLKLAAIATGENKLFLMRDSGTEIGLMPFLTLPNKCAYFQDQWYCAVPQTFPPRGVLPDDYLKHKIHTIDALVRYQSENNTLEELSSADFPPMDAEHLAIRGGQQLLFKNRYDEKLYAWELK